MYYKYKIMGFLSILTMTYISLSPCPSCHIHEMTVFRCVGFLFVNNIIYGMIYIYIYIYSSYTITNF